MALEYLKMNCLTVILTIGGSTLAGISKSLQWKSVRCTSGIGFGTIFIFVRYKWLGYIYWRNSTTMSANDTTNIKCKQNADPIIDSDKGQMSN